MKSSHSSVPSHRLSIVEVVETHFDKNTIILCVNVAILIILIFILYIVASSAMNVGSNIQNIHDQKHDEN